LKKNFPGGEKGEIPFDMREGKEYLEKKNPLNGGDCLQWRKRGGKGF